MKLRRVKLNGLMAGDRGVFQAGQVIEVSEQEAAHLVGSQQATYADVIQAKKEAPENAQRKAVLVPSGEQAAGNAPQTQGQSEPDKTGEQNSEPKGEGQDSNQESGNQGSQSGEQAAGNAPQTSTENASGNDTAKP